MLGFTAGRVYSYPVRGLHTDRPAVVFDLDGTLIDSVYQHVLAWQEALESQGIALSVWRIHRRIGMSGGLFLRALVRETGCELTAEQADNLRVLHEKGYARRIAEVRPLRPQDLGMLAAAGVTSVTVHAKPVVTIFSTGDEVVPADTRDLKPGQVRDAIELSLVGYHFRRVARSLSDCNAGCCVVFCSGNT